MHHITIKSIYLYAMIFYYMSIETVVEKYFFESRIFKIIFEQQNQIVTFSKIINKYSRTIFKRYFWSSKKLSTQNFAIGYWRLYFNIDINSLCVPSMNSIFILFENSKNFFRLIRGTNNCYSWDLQVLKGGIDKAFKTFKILRKTKRSQ